MILSFSLFLTQHRKHPDEDDDWDEPDDDDYKEDDDLERSIDDDDSDSPCDAASTSAECGVLQLGNPECYWDDDDEECKYDDGNGSFATWQGQMQSEW